MRWESLFADLEAQFAAEAARERTSEIQEIVRIERARQTMGQRLARHLGSGVEVHMLGSERLAGVLAAIGTNWLMLRHGTTEELLPFHALGWWSGTARPGGRDTGERLVGFSQALRVLVRDRARVGIGGTDGRLLASGTLDQVGQDFVEVALHARDEFRRLPAVQGRSVIPFSAISTVRREE